MPDSPAPQARPVEQEIADVLADHREDAAYPDTCVCEVESADESTGHYARHVAAALAPLIARERAAAAHEALEDTARAWQTGGWADALLPHPEPPANPTIARSNRVLDWLRDRIGGDPA